VFALKNPDVIAHYLGEANTAGGISPDLCDGRRPADGVVHTIPPPLVPSDPTIVHQSFTLTFYPDLEGGFSASLEYLTLHSANCSVSVLDHIRRKYLLNQASKRFSGNDGYHLAAQRRLLSEQHNRTHQSWNTSIWRTIEDVVAGLKVPESSKSTHTYKQSSLDHVIDLLKEKTATVLFYEEQQYHQTEQQYQHQQQQQEPRQEINLVPVQRSPAIYTPSSSNDDRAEFSDETDLLQQFGLIDEMETELQKLSLNSAKEKLQNIDFNYHFGPPIRWTYLPSVHFYQTRISM